MEILEKSANMSAQSSTQTVERRHLSKVDYFPELRSWVQRAMIEAEKNNDFKKKAQLLDLLKDL